MKNTENSIQKVESGIVSRLVWEQLESLTTCVRAMSAYRYRNEDEAKLALIMGNQMGLTVAETLEYMEPIQGRITLKPRGALAMVMKSGLLTSYSVKFDPTPFKIGDMSLTPSKCRVEMTRSESMTMQATFSLEQAARANLIKMDSGWTKYTENMLFARALGFCIDRLFPDCVSFGHQWQQSPSEQIDDLVSEIKEHVEYRVIYEEEGDNEHNNGHPREEAVHGEPQSDSEAA